VKKKATSTSTMATRTAAAAAKPQPSAKLSKPFSKANKSKTAKLGSSANAARKPEPYVPPAPLAPVPTDGKPRKNQAGLNSKELEHFRELLIAKRRELVGDMTSMEREALRTAGGTNLSNLPIHMADMGTDNYEQEFKIQDGSYGICEGTGKPITKARLEAQPWARFSIEHARKLERGMLR
jgi:RNA polymerase-binding transcription factor DksA